MIKRIKSVDNGTLERYSENENLYLKGGAIIMLDPIFAPFIEKSPISVIARGLLEHALSPDQLDEWFNSTAQEQYTKDLLFSTIFNLMSMVVRGSYHSVHSAYQATKKDINVSITSIYNKLQGIEPDISAGLVRYATDKMEPIIKQLGGTSPLPLPGKRIKQLDGNCIEKTEHRIQELRSIAAGPLPGKSLVVYDPVLRLPIDVFPCEDGHAQERSLLNRVLQTVEENDVWVADRNFCTVDFTCGIAGSQAEFIIREHKKYPFETLGQEKYIGKVETGSVYEQPISVCGNDGKEFSFRRIRVKLNKKIRNGDDELFIISSLSKSKAGAKKIARLYRDRWTIETAFQYLEKHLNSEINALGYPRAALFGFCIALVAYSIMSVVMAAIGSVHGADYVDKNVSGYYIANEISGVYLGMMIVINHSHWKVFQHMASSDLVELLKNLSAKIDIGTLKKHRRGPKKPQPKRTSQKNKPHVSTAKILARRKKK